MFQIVQPKMDNGMFSIVQPKMENQILQQVNVDGQEGLFIQNMAQNNPQFAGGQAIQIGGQQAILTPQGLVLRAPTTTTGLIPSNILQQVHMPTGMFYLISIIIKLFLTFSIGGCYIIIYVTHYRVINAFFVNIFHSFIHYFSLAFGFVLLCIFF